MSVQKLQQTIDQSKANAKGFARDLFKEPWSAAKLQDFVNKTGSITVATIDKQGKPHAAVVAAGCADGKLYIGVTPRTALLGNLRRNDDVGFTVGGIVVGQGTATERDEPAELKAVAPQVGGILRGAIEQDWNGHFYAIEPSKIFATDPG